MSEVVKKGRVIKENLPPVSSTTGDYTVRYRIISEDKNRTSAWLPAQPVDPGYVYTPGKISITSSSSSVNVVWDAVKVKVGTGLVFQAKEYDVWIKWSKADTFGDWEYMETISGNSIALVVPDTYYISGVDQESAPNRISIEVYLRGEPVVRGNTVLRMYAPGIHTI